MTKRFFRFLFLIVLLLFLFANNSDYIFAPATSGQLLIKANRQWNTGSTIVRFRDDVTVVSPVKLNRGSSSQLNIDLSGTLSSLSNSQLRLYAWNTTSTGRIQLILNVTSATNPTYALNLQNYSYAASVISGYTQRSNETVTVSFETLGTGLKVYSATIPLASVSYTLSVTQEVLLISGEGSGTIKILCPNGRPSEVKLDNVVQNEGGTWSFVESTKILTLTGGSTPSSSWLTRWQIGSDTGVGVQPPPPPSPLSLKIVFLQVQVTQNTTNEIVVPIQFSGVSEFTVDSVSTNASWVQFISWEPSASNQIILKFRVTPTTQVAPGKYIVTFELVGHGSGRIVKQGVIGITVLEALPAAGPPANWMLLSVGALILFALYQRSRRRKYAASHFSF